MRRRAFVLAAGALAAAPRLVRAQQAKKLWRVGFANAAATAAARRAIEALEQGLRDHGYVIGTDVAIEVVSVAGKLERLPQAMRELAGRKVDVIVATSNPIVEAARAATRTIPIVMVAATDVVRSGLVRSLSRPGGNVTGLTWDVGVAFVTKRLQLLKEVAPRISRVGVLWEPPYEEQFRAPTDEAAARLGVGTDWVRISGRLEDDFASMVRGHCDAFFPHLGPSMAAQRERVVALASQHRLPSAFPASTAVEAGGLMSYAPNYFTQLRSAARFIDRILKGANPADMPVEQPTALEFVINLKTARALGLTIAPTVLVRADRVIE